MTKPEMERLRALARKWLEESDRYPGDQDGKLELEQRAAELDRLLDDLDRDSA